MIIRFHKDELVKVTDNKLNVSSYISALVFRSIHHVPVTFFFLRAPLNGHQDNTGTMACPLGVHINLIPR